MSSVLCYDVLGSCRGRLRHGHYRCFDEVHLHRDVTAHRRVADAHVLRDLSIKNRTFYPTFLIVSLQNIKPIVFLSYSSQAFWGLLMFCTAEKFGVEMSRGLHTKVNEPEAFWRFKKATFASDPASQNAKWRQNGFSYRKKKYVEF